MIRQNVMKIATHTCNTCYFTFQGKHTDVKKCTGGTQKMQKNVIFCIFYLLKVALNQTVSSKIWQKWSFSISTGSFQWTQPVELKLFTPFPLCRLNDLQTRISNFTKNSILAYQFFINGFFKAFLTCWWLPSLPILSGPRIVCVEPKNYMFRSEYLILNRNVVARLVA